MGPDSSQGLRAWPWFSEISLLGGLGKPEEVVSPTVLPPGRATLNQSRGVFLVSKAFKSEYNLEFIFLCLIKKDKHFFLIGEDFFTPPLYPVLSANLTVRTAYLETNCKKICNKTEH